MFRDELGDRMKRYESVPQTVLMRRTPVVIRIDGKAFHSFTKGFKRPWDDVFQRSMQDTLLYLCQNIQNCVFGYQQSDEITLILTDYATLTTDAWFGYEVQKLCSISASMATMQFNRAFKLNIDNKVFTDLNLVEDADYYNTLCGAAKKGAMFDARCFSIPKEEVTNLIYWRQKDAIRNSIQSMGRTHFSHKMLEGKKSDEIKALLNGEWDNAPICWQRGVACVKDENGWHIDLEIPIFEKEDREYIERLI